VILIDSNEQAHRRAVIHPISLVAIALLVLNDHVFKSAFHNALTGKLSDIAGMVFFPALLTSAFLALRPASTRPERVLLLSAIATAVVFTLVKTTVWANESFAVSLGVLQWPFRAVRALLSHSPYVLSVHPARTLRDFSDVIAAPFVFTMPLAFWRRRARMS
jgi:hypothetical protein